MRSSLKIKNSKTSYHDFNKLKKKVTCTSVYERNMTVNQPLSTKFSIRDALKQLPLSLHESIKVPSAEHLVAE